MLILNPKSPAMFHLKNVVLLLAFSFFLACSKDQPMVPEEEPITPPEEVSMPMEMQPETTESNLLNVEDAITHNASLLESILNLITTEDFDFTFENVSSQKIIYQTQDLEGNLIEASGVLFLPTASEPKGIVSLQHSTIQSNDQAPSNSVVGANEYTVGALFASSGYLTIMPDHIGYGISNAQRHLYELKDTYTHSTYDLLLASHDYLTNNSLEIPEPLFLVGYSNGAYASLALHQFIEEEHALEVTETFAGAGAYDKTTFTKSLLTSDQDLDFLGTYLWVLDVYNKTYPNLNRPWNEYLQEPFASQITSLGDLAASVPDELIDLNAQNLFLETFIEGILENTDEAFLNALADNDVVDWTPLAPINLYHGTEDDFVFPLNSENAFEQFQSNGATVSYQLLEAESHSATAVPFFFEVLKRLQDF